MNPMMVRLPLVRSGSMRRHRAGETAARLLASLALVLQGLLPGLIALPATTAYAESGRVRARTASVTISLDTSSQSPGTNTCTTIQLGPVATESSAGTYATGTTVTLTAPLGFAFCDPTAAATKAEVNAEATYLRFLDTGNALRYSVSPTLASGVLSVTIGRKSDAAHATLSSPASIEFTSLQVKPTNGAPATGNITVGGTAGASGNGGTLTSVAGEAYAAEFSTQPVNSGNVTASLSTQPVAKVKDRFGNELGTGNVQLSLAGGTSGAALVCTTNPVAISSGAANTATFAGCKVSKSGTGYTLVATSGAATAVSTSFDVAAVAPSGVAVKALSGSNSANFISIASAATVTFDVTFPAGGPGEAGTVTATLSLGSASVSGTAVATSGQTTATISSVDASSLGDGTVTVTAKFTGGRDSTVITGTPAIKDEVLPTPGTLALDSASDTGSSASDMVTRVDTPSFSLSAASDTGAGIASVQLQVSTDGTTWTDTGTADTASPYQVTATTLAAHTYYARARVTDAAGNADYSTTVNGIVIDTAAPAAPVQANLTITDSTAGTNDTVAGSAPAVEGSATVKAFSDSALTVQVGADATASSDGSFSAIMLGDNKETASGTGTGTFYLVAIDAAGNRSVPTTVTVDATANAKPSAAQVNNAGGSGATANATDVINNASKGAVSVDVTFAAPPEAGTILVTLTGGATVTGTATVESGTASTTFTVTGINASSLTDGTVSVSATHTDAKGNTKGAFTGTPATKDVVATAPNGALVKAGGSGATANTTDVINFASKGAVSVDVTFAAPPEAGTILVTLTGGATETGTAIVPSGTALTTFTVTGINASSLTDGTVTVSATFDDTRGNVSSAFSVTTATKDTTPPTVTIVGDATVTSSDTSSANPNGKYKIGDAISVGVAFSESVTVAGTPMLKLNTSQAGGAAAYSGGTGTATLTFTYTIVANDEASDLNQLDASALIANDGTNGTITDLKGNSATLSLSGVTSLASAHAIVVDGVRPTVTVVGDTGTTADGTKKIGETVDVTVTFSEAVTYAAGTGALGLTLETGTTDRTVDYLSGSGSAVLTFRYTVLEGDAAADLDAVALAVTSDATLRDASGNDATLGLSGATSLASAHAIVVDGVRPRLATIVRAASAAQVTSGASSPTYTVTFSEPVLGVTASNFVVTTGAGITGTPTITVASSPAAATNWTVSLGLTSVTGTGAADATLELVLADPTGITDTVNGGVGNTMTNVSPTGGAGATYLLDNSAATILSVSTTKLGGTYKAATMIDILVTFSEAVIVTGTPQLTLETGTTDRTVDYLSGSGSAVLTFRYTVQPGDTTADLDATALALNGGTIVDRAGTNATLTLPTGANSLAGSTNTDGSAKTIVIDTTAPSESFLSLASYDSGNASDAITNQEDITLAVTAEANASVAITATKDGSTFTLDSGASTGAGAPRAFSPRKPGVNGAAPAALDDGTYVFSAVATDTAGNASNAATFTVIIDTAAPDAPTALALTIDTDTGASTSDGITNRTSVSVTGSATSGTSVQLFKNGIALGSSATSTGTFTSPTVTLTTGGHGITATATDTAGNTSAPSTALVISVDQAGPGVAIAAPAHRTFVGTATPTFTALALDTSGVVSVQFKARVSASPTFAMVGSAVTLASPAFTYTLMAPAPLGADGSYVVTATATDTAGNTADAGELAFTIDTAPPTVSVTAPVSGVALRSARPVLTANVIDTNGVVAVGFGVKVPGALTFVDAVGTLTNEGASYSLTLGSALASDGAYQVVVIARDVAGNIATSAPISFSIDTSPTPATDTSPSVEVAKPAPVTTIIPVAPPVTVPVAVVTAPPAAAGNATAAVAFAALDPVAAQALGSALASVPETAAKGLGAALGGAGAQAATALLTKLATLPPAQVVAVASVTGSLPTAQGAALVTTLASLPAAQLAAVADVASALPASSSAQVFGAIAQLAQSSAGPIAFAAPASVSKSATGVETVTYSLDDEAPVAQLSSGDAEVAGVRVAVSGQRTVVILVKPGQVARLTRPRSGAWPELVTPLTSGKQAGLMPVITLPVDVTAATFDPAPSSLSIVEQGSVGGGNVIPLGAPFNLRLEGGSAGVRANFAMPSIKVAPGQTFAYLFSLRSAAGNFLGYLRAPATFDAPTGRQAWSLATGEASDLLVIPVALQPAYVQNFDASVHIYSGPDAFAADFGEAGPAFTTFTVVGPQIGSRILVHSPVTRNLGWIDVSGVGPSGPPTN